MARLAEDYQGDWKWHWDKTKEKFEDYMKRTDEMFEAIPKDKMVSFSVADGGAYYYVKSFKPLVLQHIPYGDAYMAPAALIRGLRTQDVVDEIEFKKKLTEIFSKKDGE